jgi:hypothetical protein
MLCERIKFSFLILETFLVKMNYPYGQRERLYRSFCWVCGSDRTDFADRTFAKDESAWNMVKQRGLSDEDITRVWTQESVRKNRLKLFFSYLITAVFWGLVFALSTALEINSGAKDHRR